MLSKFSVKRPLTIVVVMIIIIMLGVVAYTRMSTDLLPSIDLPYLIIVTSYPGATPEAVEATVTKPLEQAMATASNIKNITSTSGENVSMVMCEFYQDVNMDSVMIEADSKISQVSAAWEDDVGAPFMLKLNPDMMPVMVSAVRCSNMDEEELSAYVTEEIVPALESVEGVAAVSAEGVVEKQIEVEISQEKIDRINAAMLRSVNAELAEAETALQSAQEQLDAGRQKLNAETSSQGAKLTEGLSALAQGETELAQNESALTQKQQQLAEALSQLEAAETQANETLGLIASARAEAQTQRATLLMQRATAEQLPDTQAKAQLLAQIDAQLAAIDTQTEQLDAQEAQINASLPGIVQQKEQLVNGKSQVDSGLEQLNAGKAELAAQKEQLTAAETMLSTTVAQAAAQLDTAQATLDEKRTEFTAARDQALEQASIDGIITVEMIQQILAAENFSMPAGYVQENGMDTIVKVGDKLTGQEEIGELLLFSLGLDEVDEVRLKDVAEIRQTDNIGDLYAKLNNHNGVLLTMERQSTYSTTETAQGLREKMDELCAENPELEFVNMLDQGVYIDIVIQSVLNNLLMGALLAVIVLFLFLRSVKPTLVVATSIPISVIFAIVLMYFSGVTLNIISLAGLALGVGMLVDNSIVVIENIYRLRALGYPAKKAAVEGAKRVTGAIIASTATTISVFLPIIFTSGITRELFTDMALTIAYSLLASLMVALTLVPAMSSGLLLNMREQKATRIGSAILRGYEKALKWCLRFKPVVIIGIVAVFVFSAMGALSQGMVLMPSMESTQMSATITMPKENTPEQNAQTADEITQKILTIDDVESVGVMLSGNSGMTSMMSSGSGASQFVMYLVLDEQKEMTNAEIRQKIYDLTQDLPAELSVSESTMDMSALSGSGLSVRIEGQEYDPMLQAVGDIEQMMAQTEGTAEIDNGIGDTAHELRITVDKDRAMQKGLTVAQVYMEVASQISGGTTATTITQNDQDYPVVVVDGSAREMQTDDVENILIPISPASQPSAGQPAEETEEETEVRLGDIAQVEMGESPMSIQREDQMRTITVTAQIDNDHNIGLVGNEFAEKLAGYQPPEGVTVEMSGENMTILETVSQLLYMLALAVVLIYLIMVVQFQSLKSPFIVMFTMPLAFTGGFLALCLCGYEISMISLLGFLVLTGIVVNNGIVLVDCVNQLRLSGMSRQEALAEAGKMRMRPIFMTALTTILGLLTLSLGMGMGADMLQPMAAVVIGGLLYATVLTLFFVPVLYDCFNKKELKRREIEEDDGNE